MTDLKFQLSGEHGASRTEAWADAESVVPETGVVIPKEDAVERAKEWVEDNEK